MWPVRQGLSEFVPSPWSQTLPHGGSQGKLTRTFFSRPKLTDANLDWAFVKKVRLPAEVRTYLKNTLDFVFRNCPSEQLDPKDSLWALWCVFHEGRRPEETFGWDPWRGKQRETEEWDQDQNLRDMWEGGPVGSKVQVRNTITYFFFQFCSELLNAGCVATVTVICTYKTETKNT